MAFDGTVTNAAEITVLEPIRDATFQAAGNPVAIGATVIAARKGPVGEVVRLKRKYQSIAETITEVFGKPFDAGEDNREGLYHLWDALHDCEYVNVVRVAPSDALFPTISMDDTGTITAGTEAYGTEITLGTGDVFTVYPKDGDPSTSRDMDIVEVAETYSEWATETSYTLGDIIKYGSWRNWFLKANETHTSGTGTLSAEMDKWDWTYLPAYTERFVVVFYDDDADGTEYELERFTVSIDPDAVDDLGRSAYFPVVLEEQSKYFACVHNLDEQDFSSLSTHLSSWTKTTFAGGTNGVAAIATADWTAGWDAFSNQQVQCDLMFLAGNMDSVVIAHVADIAQARRSQAFFDVASNQTSANAMAELLGWGIDSRFAAAYYCPLSAKNPFGEGRVVWGASGAAASAAAKSSKIFSGNVPGVHYPPAGMKRGQLERTGIIDLQPTDAIDRLAFYNARLNPVLAGDFTGAVISDCLSASYVDDYSRFIWVNRISNYIDQRFLAMARFWKFDPNSSAIAGLTRGMRRILDECVTAGMLTTPRNPEVDGTEPYTFEVAEIEIDLIQVKYSYCPVGAARRIVGQPIWIR